MPRFRMVFYDGLPRPWVQLVKYTSGAPCGGLDTRGEACNCWINADEVNSDASSSLASSLPTGVLNYNSAYIFL